jgi:hypothetical protein
MPEITWFTLDLAREDVNRRNHYRWVPVAAIVAFWEAFATLTLLVTPVQGLRSLRYSFTALGAVAPFLIIGPILALRPGILRRLPVPRRLGLSTTGITIEFEDPSAWIYRWDAQGFAILLTEIRQIAGGLTTRWLRIAVPPRLRLDERVFDAVRAVATEACLEMRSGTSQLRWPKRVMTTVLYRRGSTPAR